MVHELELLTGHGAPHAFQQSDWISSSYSLHKLGRIWRVKPKQMPVVERPLDPELAIRARDRRVREGAARKLMATPEKFTSES